MPVSKLYFYFQGIPRPLPINKPRSNRDSFISDDDDLIKEAFIVSKSKSVTDTEEFKKAVESFDQMFSEEGGNETPEIKRLSMQSSPEVKRMSIPMMQTSPNVNWKRIKTSRSFEKDESSEHQEIHESQEAYSVRTETNQMESNQTSFKTSEKKESMEQHQQYQSHSVSQEHHEVSHKVSENYQEQTFTKIESSSQQHQQESSTMERRSKKKRRSRTGDNLADEDDEAAAAQQVREKKKQEKHKRRSKHESMERMKLHDSSPVQVEDEKEIEDEDLEERKISLIGEEYKDETNETMIVHKHSLIINPVGVMTETVMETQIDADIIKNVDGTAKQRKGSSRFSKKQRDKSKSPGMSNRASCSEPDVEQGVCQFAKISASLQNLLLEFV